MMRCFIKCTMVLARPRFTDPPRSIMNKDDLGILVKIVQMTLNVYDSKDQTWNIMITKIRKIKLVKRLIVL
uniref:Uncharacterized protein n=1 Tax=Acrobeloides nanus TaxID=290746 RepID=A0A914ER62_9BILA